MTKLSRSIFFVSFREKIKSGYDVEIVISNFFTALYFDTGPSPHSVQIIIHLRFYLYLQHFQIANQIRDIRA